MSLLAPRLDLATVTIGGREVSTPGTFEVINPATGEPFAVAPNISASQLDDAFTAASTAQLTWRNDEQRRRAALRDAADAIDAAAPALAGILTAEQGKPMNDALAEIGAATYWLRYYAELDLPREIVQNDENGYAEVLRRPLGVVAAITPWNFPIALAMWKIAPALLAGNTMVIKPSPFTPLTTLAMGAVLRDVLPAGVLNVISGTDPLGAAMSSHPVPRKISFTGSTATGKKVAAAAAEDLKRLTLELGGNDPAVVLPGTDVAAIAPSLFWGAFGNNGQICLAAKRVYAHESLHADLVEALAEIARSVHVDEGTVEGAQLGPINNLPQYDRVSELVADALSNGARAAAGGRRIDRPGYFFEPTILDRVDDGIRIVDEEQFGPALPVVAYSSVDDAVDRANASMYGLTASVWGSDLEEAYAVAGRIDSGQVSINSHGGAVLPHLPFGGHKWSGVGVENGPWGLYGFTELQVIQSPPRG